VTIKGGTVQKVTFADDSAGTSYVNAQQSRGERRVGVANESLILIDGTQCTQLAIGPSWGSLREMPVSRGAFL
jgi:hypothetical protein